MTLCSNVNCKNECNKCPLYNDLEDAYERGYDDGRKDGNYIAATKVFLLAKNFLAENSAFVRENDWNKFVEESLKKLEEENE